MTERVRLDKWLWAARFFKTRGKAKEAIVGGKVQCDGQRAKPAREISVGTVLRIRRSEDEETVEVVALSEHRGGASDARTLYAETPESLAAREAAAERRRISRESFQHPTARPGSRDRRTLERIKRGDS